MSNQEELTDEQKVEISKDFASISAFILGNSLNSDEHSQMLSFYLEELEVQLKLTPDQKKQNFIDSLFDLLEMAAVATPSQLDDVLIRWAKAIYPVLKSNEPFQQWWKGVRERMKARREFRKARRQARKDGNDKK